MHVVAEALGMSLPGGAPVLANSPKLFEFARLTGERIVGMVLDDLRPRQILTPGAFANAVRAVLASSGSINTVKHLQATATEGQLPVDVFALFEELSRTVPMLSAVRPNGNRSIEEFEAAGGARALLKRLEPLLDRDALTVTGRTVGENLAGFEVPGDSDLPGDFDVPGDEVIRPLERPISTEAPIVIMRGTLAPESAIVKRGGPDGQRRTTFSGPAVVCEDGNEAMAAVVDGRVRAGDVLVLRGGGLKGGPGMAGRASMVAFLLYSAGLENEVALVTDGQLSGLVNKGLVVGEVSPESAAGGPLALVRDGDRISIDVQRRTVDLDVDPDELAKRQAAPESTPLPAANGYLSIYQRAVRPMSTGAVLGRNG
jgi:dihydroxy-acid dehydratase